MPPIQYWFTGAALAAFIGLLASMLALGVAWWRAAVTEQEVASGKAASAAQKLKTDRVKDLLGKALASGDKLIRSQNEKNEDQFRKDAEEWGQQTRELIAAAYGEGEAALFLDSSGYLFYGGGSSNSKVRNWIDGRMRRISELLKRTDALNPKTDFDPAIFD